MDDTADNLDPLIKRLRALAATDDYAMRGGRQKLAGELGVSYQQILRLLTKEHRPQRQTVEKLAAFFNERHIPATPAEASPSTTLPNLSVCLAYHGPQWPPYAVAAAKAGAFSHDVPANVWPSRLNALKRAIEACAASETDASAAICKSDI
jgi:hypothetical protein